MTTKVSRTGRRWTEPIVDAPPEFWHFEDTGCDVAPACLRCPLPVCKYDDPLAKRREMRRVRYAPVLLLLGQGVPAREVAEQTGISARTVARLKAGSR